MSELLLGGIMRHKYRGSINIDIDNTIIDVNLDIGIREIEESEITLYLNKNMEVVHALALNNEEIIIGNEIADWNPFFNNTIELKVLLPDNRNNLDLQLKYSGKIDDTVINQISTDWTELGIYSPWFPLIPSLQEIEFEIETLHSSTRNSKLIYPEIKSALQCIDFPIFLSNQFESTKYSNERINVEIHHRNQCNSHLVKLIKNEVFEILDFYKVLFGEISNAEKLNILIAPRLEGGGYCRKNLIVLTEENIETEKAQRGFTLYLAHELAHIWWNKSDKTTWEDWLNESFAEYSALLYEKEKYGMEIFNDFIEVLNEKSKGLSCIYQMERVSETSFELLNYKGPFIISKLHSKIGDDSFCKLLRQINEVKISKTEDLLELIEKDISKEVGKYLFEKLQC